MASSYFLTGGFEGTVFHLGRYRILSENMLSEDDGSSCQTGTWPDV